MECNTNLTLGPGRGAVPQEANKKKLRLSKQQSSLLENTFRDHNTLNSVQKQELSDCLNLRPRQVEVWFQNRRARTKLKKTEMDCGIWKRYCETLAEENRRLKMEIEALMSRKPSCALCQQIATAEDVHVSPRFYGFASRSLRWPVQEALSASYKMEERKSGRQEEGLKNGGIN